MEKNLYKYSLGNIEGILAGDLDKFNSFENLPYQKQEGLIVVPKYAGVYQESRLFSDITGIMLASPLARFTGKGIEKSDSNLICILYDPTIVKEEEEIIFEAIDPASRDRIKVCSYTDIPNFNEKQFPLNAIEKIIKNIGERDLSPAERNVAEIVRERIRNIRKAYGFTRIEYFFEKNMDEIFGTEIKKGILDNPEELKRAREFRKSTDNIFKNFFGFGDFKDY